MKRTITVLTFHQLNSKNSSHYLNHLEISLLGYIYLQHKTCKIEDYSFRKNE
jgi:hypothetical protein